MVQAFFRMGGFSMLPVLLCGMAALGVALYATGRPAAHRIQLAERLGWAELFFAGSGLFANVATTLWAVAHASPEGEGFRTMLVTGLYESSAPAIMGLSFLALVHVALAIAGYRLAHRDR
jgi:hypothetical protein